MEFARQLDKEIKFFSVEELQKKVAEYKLRESDFVKKIVGVGNICEAAALCCVERGKFSLEKKSFGGVTVALLFEK